MVAKEIFILRSVLENHGPLACLEWGSGYSTIFYSQLLRKGARWYSVEHDRKWFGEIGPKLRTLANVELALVEPDNQPWTDEYHDGSYEDVERYILYPGEQLKMKFDFILIDGRGRRHCLARARDIASPKGVIIVHDANRKHYFTERKARWKHEHFFTDARPDAGGLFIASDAKIDDEIGEYRKVWDTSARWEPKRIFGMFFK